MSSDNIPDNKKKENGENDNKKTKKTDDKKDKKDNDIANDSQEKEHINNVINESKIEESKPKTQDKNQKKVI